MIGGGQRAVGGDQHRVANGDAVAGIDDSARINGAVGSNGEVAHAAGSLDLDERIDRRPSANLDQCSAYGGFDVRQR